MSAALPLKGTRSHHHHPCAPCCVEKMVTVSVPLFYFFHFNQIFSQLNCYLVGRAATIPQSLKGTRSHHHHPPATCCMEKMVTVSFPFFICFPFQFFSAFFLQLNCNFVPHASHLPQSIKEKGPIITIPVSPAAWSRC